ncbi:hypothetical protein NBO_72g0019 [Nosema bombycis CQ1]|uniref:Uncharacterized protein n=1 Tax=Nosema bombycis (strain CQ1 / CVCC 102059) TaxID=578461 RepID=R0MH79_NOSB1|nr:hypothetical protein NBO_72g0019 [Nosema bombycis CQ1]|eukprot:EOB13485.1 hypothetical protein NBO_72g0019 [Nosema bombycis CQ1]
MVVKNIKKSKGVSNCVFIDIENIKYILINMNDRIELYDLELKFIKNIEFGKFISNINICLIDNKEYLIIITIEGEYMIRESKFIINGENDMDMEVMTGSLNNGKNLHMTGSLNNVKKSYEIF